MTGEIPPSFLYYTSGKQSHRFSQFWRSLRAKNLLGRRELTRFQRIFLLLALSKTPGVSLAELRGQAAMLSWLLVSVTHLQLGMLNLQAAGNADPASLPSSSVPGGCLPRPLAASLGS